MNPFPGFIQIYLKGKLKGRQVSLLFLIPEKMTRKFAPKKGTKKEPEIMQISDPKIRPEGMTRKKSDPKKL